MTVSRRICFVGDSFVNGTGDPACLGWSGRVCADMASRGHEVTYYNLGVRRETTSDILARWRAEVDARLPLGFAAGIVFSFGVNDTTHENGAPRVAIDRTLDNALTILRDASSVRKVLFVGPPPVVSDEHNGRIRSLCSELQRVADSVGVPYLPVFEQLLAVPTWREEAKDNDGAHPHTGGYQALAALVGAWPAWRAWFAHQHET